MRRHVFRRRLVVRSQGASTAASFQIRCWRSVAPFEVGVYDQPHKVSFREEFVNLQMVGATTS